MLKTTELNNKSAGQYARSAAIRADMYSRECRLRYTAAQHAQVETFGDVVMLAYSGRCYITYRKTYITVKVEYATVRDRKTVSDVDSIAGDRGYQKTRSPQGVAYRVKFVAK
jgi:hypothetical protein